MAEPDNLHTTKELYRLFNAGDIAGLLNHFDNHTIYHYHAPRELVPYGGGITGVAAIGQMFAQLDALYEFELFEPREFIAAGDKVIVTGVLRVKLKATGEVISSDWIHIPQFKNGKLVRNDLFEDSAQTARALAGRNIAIAQRVIEEAWNQGNLAVIDELYSPAIVSHDPASLPDEQGLEGRKRAALRYRKALPDIHFALSDFTATGELVYYHWQATATHTGELNGIPATGKKITVTGTATDRIVNGKIVEEWSHWDTLGMLQQLGVIPAA